MTRGSAHTLFSGTSYRLFSGTLMRRAGAAGARWGRLDFARATLPADPRKHFRADALIHPG